MDAPAFFNDIIRESSAGEQRKSPFAGGTMMPYFKSASTLAVFFGYVAMTGCSSSTDRDLRMQRGNVYYLDGAGGGGAMRNYAKGVRKGLEDAGYAGSGEIFNWETGLGVVADQTSSEEYKRDRAANLASQIRDYHAKYPSAPITLMGLSAGTAVAVFTLESLPADVDVENVILLSGSLGSSYDLTKALRRVRDKMYVFTSSSDAVLGFLVPISGTADRASGSETTIGLSGPRMPASGSSETRNQYAKIVQVPWNKEFEDYGNYGGHTDTVKAAFVQAVVAPLVISKTAPTVQLASAEKGEQLNPMFQRWSGFGVGSWVEFRGHQMIDGRQIPVRVKSMVVRVDKDAIMISRLIEGLTDGGDASPIERRLFVTRTVSPERDPQLNSRSVIKEEGQTQVNVGDRRLTCVRRSVAASGDFPEWGIDPRFDVLACPDIPGSLAALSLQTVWNGRPTEISVEAVDYSVVR